MSASAAAHPIWAWPQGVAATAPVADTVRRLAGGGDEGAAWPRLRAHLAR
jgi:hypothetical protein